MTGGAHGGHHDDHPGPRLSPVRQIAPDVTVVRRDWLVDPGDGVVTVLELTHGASREVARGDDVTGERPFPVRVRLSR